MDDRSLVLIDGMALVYRGHYAMIRNPRYTSTGMNTSAIFVFVNVLLGVFEKTQASHLAVVFDTREPTFRHRLYAEYKATRDAMPEDIVQALPYLERLLEALRVPSLRCPGYEADDLIGTLARQAEEQGYRVIMVTPDKDYAQLVSPACSIWRPAKGGGGFDILGPDEVCAEWEVERVEQVIEVLGLMGDTSDNIPGVPGIGPKTARELIARYGSIEGIYQHLDALKGKRKENLSTFHEQALLSRQLVTIDRCVPCNYAIEDLIKRSSDQEALQSVLEELEFRALASRLIHDAEVCTAPEQPPQDLDQVQHDYQLVESPEDCQAFFQALEAQQRFAIDCETDGLDARHCRLLGLSFSWQEGAAYYLPWPEEPRQQAALREGLAPILADPGREKVGHHLKFDCAVLRAHQLPLEGPLWDTMLAAWLCLPDVRRSMDALSEHLLGYRPIPITALIGEKGSEQRSMAEVPLADLARYAAEDADVTWRLAAALAQPLADSGQEELFRRIECPLIPVLCALEEAGIAIDCQALEELGQALEERISSLSEQINSLAGSPININSPKQLGTLLFDTLGLDARAKRTAKSGQYQTNEKVLQRLAHKHPIAQHILDYREASKLKSTYVDQLPKAIDPQSGRIHSHFDQAATSTGRLASHNPNLQNIPIRSDMGRAIRRAFVPGDADHLILSLDYSQIELRLAAELSADQALRQAFASRLDFHTATAATLYNLDPQEVDSELRRRAKTVNFGILYGVSAFGLAEQLAIPRHEAKALIDAYYQRFHGLRAWMDALIETAREQGWVSTLNGRRRELRDILSRNAAARAAAERLAINTPIQGTAAELIKAAMIQISQHLHKEGCRSRLLLQVHDELVFELHRSEADQLPEELAHIMRTAMPLETPLEVSYGIADNWLDAH